MVRIFCTSFILVASFAFSGFAQTKNAHSIAARPEEKVDPSIERARVFLDRHEYGAAKLALGAHAKSLEAKWIAAETRFRLNQFAEAKPYFEEIIKETKDPVDRKKAAIRLFDCELLSGDREAAIRRFVNFEKEYKSAPPRMKYALGKYLYDQKYLEHAESILSAIPWGNEYSMRAHYIGAAIGLGKRSPDASAKMFLEIEKQEPKCVEDYAVRDLAILAQARIRVDEGRFDRAKEAYLRVPVKSGFGERATIELVRAMLNQAELALLGEGRFNKVSAFHRKRIEEESIHSALSAIESFRKVRTIDFRNPELLTVMGELYIETKRYDEALLAFSGLIDHYRPIQSSLNTQGNKAIWPYFVLDYARNKNLVRRMPVIEGVPDEFIKNVPEMKQITSLRDSIEESGRKLITLSEMAKARGQKSLEGLEIASTNQRAMEGAYGKLVLKKQSVIAQKVAASISESLAEAEFKRAEAVLARVRDATKQVEVVHDFQSRSIEQFEDSLKAIGEGSSS